MKQMVNEWMKKKLESVNVCTSQYVGWLMSDPQNWYEFQYIHAWLAENPEPIGPPGSLRWEKELGEIRMELKAMLGRSQYNDDQPFDEDFRANVDFESIAEWIEEKDPILGYIQDNTLMTRLYLVTRLYEVAG